YYALLILTFLLLSSIVESLRADDMGDWEHMKSIRPRGYVCGQVITPPKLDGKLDEAAWQTAPWTEDFVDIEGDKKPNPRQRTRVKMVWDQQFLYIGAELMEEQIQASLTQHDAVIFHDNDFELFLDPEGDNHEYFEFEMNALNTTWDLYLPKPYKDGGVADNGWEFPGLKSAVDHQGTLNNPTDRDKSWTLEIAIPWSCFEKRISSACPPIDGDQWRINFSRVEWQFQVVDGKYSKVPNTREDNWVWSPQGIIDMHRPERWGILEFTKSEPGKQELTDKQQLAARDALMEIYHRQRTYHGQHKRWASSVEELGIRQPNSPMRDVSIQARDVGFRATLPVMNGKTKQFWNVRQDSKLWMTLRSNDATLRSKPEIEKALESAGSNREQLELALEQSPAEHLEAIEFLIANMPERDAKSLSARFLLDNTRLAYDAWNAALWKRSIPNEIFLNNVLPYANINERRDEWRKSFREQFLPLIADAKTPSHAAALLNQKLFPLVKVRYSTQRAKADQSPIESMKSGLASCTGLSILLIDACRACGIPARFVGTPLWSDNSGNHSWVEVWDDGWHFTGAAEPNGNELDKAWFVGRASTAVRENDRNAIYAVSFLRTPISFPLVWDKSIDYIKAVNVTDRYTQLNVKPPAGKSLTMIRVTDAATGNRVAAHIKILDTNKVVQFEGLSNDDRFDTNDHLSVYLPTDQHFTAQIQYKNAQLEENFRAESRTKPIHWIVPMAQRAPVVPETKQATSHDIIDVLKTYLAKDASERIAPANIPDFIRPIARDQAASAMKLLRLDRLEQIKASRAQEMESSELCIGELKMPFAFKTFGDKPSSGWSMYISMHGGGGAPTRVNNQQWENQKKLYQLEEGMYVAPRAPTDTWDLWHQSHIDLFLDRLIENFVAFHDVNPNRIYLLGYSAGGDGVYQVAPRMADRFAAASMMAGHPNETSPLGLRNLPFAIHMGENDSAYNRNKVATEWSTKLAELRKQDADGYEHVVKLHQGKGHWMDRQDAEAIAWMARFDRIPYPERIVWKQDDVRESRFYWLAADKGKLPDRALTVATRNKQKIELESSDSDRMRLLLSDAMMDLDLPVQVAFQNKNIFEGIVARNVANIAQSLSERIDLDSTYCAQIEVDLTKFR
ncbi:MAG: transglutaminase domain-containing protein, partial [Pirellula sp.]